VGYRHERVLIQTTLDDAVSEDHEVRLLDEVLRAQDWSAWEAEYSQGRGQPGIRPRVVASAILYGRLTEGRTIDHSRLCKIRTRFKDQLKELFRALGRMALTMGRIRLGEVTFDGTRVKANNGRFETWTSAAVEKRLAELEAEFGKLLEQAEQSDAAENEQFGMTTPAALPPDLADAKVRQQRLQETLERLRAAACG
jgi:transposase